MSNSSEPSGSSLAGKLNHLFETVCPAGRGPYNTEEAARVLTASGVPISGSYIWMLRRGQRDNPTLRHVEALAKLFGVPPAYFFDDRVTEEVDAQLRLLTVLRDSKVHSVALRAAGLSPESLDSISEVIERVRELEGLPREATDRES